MLMIEVREKLKNINSTKDLKCYYDQIFDYHFFFARFSLVLKVHGVQVIASYD